MRILLPVDGSEPSEVATRAVTKRPWPPDTKIRVLSVVQEVRSPSDAFAAEIVTDYGEWSRLLAEEAGRHTARAAHALREAGLSAETAVRHGDPRVEIVEDARTWGADLIVIGSHGRTGMRRLLVGSVAEHVVRHAHCSVEVARGTVPAE